MKKRSATNSAPPSPPNFFVDRALGNKIVVEAIRAAGEIVHAHDDHFAPDAPDSEWLTQVGRNGWIVLTKDAKIRYRTIEREALLNANVRAFVFVSGNLPASETARIFVAALPSIKKFVGEHPAPFIAKIYKDCKVESWL